jgi:Tat protein translocase TatB subunit
VLNIGGGEMLVIMLLALIVLGPQRLPDAARQVGKAMGEIRRLSSGFQRELKSALDDSTEADARAKGAVFTPVQTDAPAVAPTPEVKKKAAPRKRTAPLRAAGKPSNGSAP